MIERRTLLAAGLSAAAIHTAAAADAPIATTSAGKVRGTIEDGIRIFKGIPYATAARFRAPKPAPAWTGIRDALAYGPMSPQVAEPRASIFASWTFDDAMSEDCMALNVWTPGLDDRRHRPVMVWFHGGGFSSLSGSRNVFDGTRLCKRGDVVVITMNHRLNIFGYLHLADLAPDFQDGANAGMLDLVEALRWVRTNIGAFGGDPDNVTIFGQSGGGGKVSCMTAMPVADGLFNRAIVQSGSFIQAGDREAGTRQTKLLLAALDMAPADAAKLADLPLDTLLAGYAKALKSPEKPDWRPIVDGKWLPSGPWAPGAPAISTDVPMMIGTVATEMTLLTGARDPATFTLDDAALRERLGTWFAPGDIEHVIATFKATRPNATPSDIFFAVATDKAMRERAWQQAERKAVLHGSAPVYFYELTWKTPVEGGKWQTPHSLDLAFVFDNVAKSAAMVGTGPEPQKLADQMSAAWLAFAHTGNPNHKGIPHWPAYTLPARATMVFDVQSSVKNDFGGNERQLLASLPPKPTG